MTDQERERCQNAVISEDYFDFIQSDIRTDFFSSLSPDDLCALDAGYGYQCLYLNRSLAGTLSLSRFPYNSIPKCYAPISMEALNQSGILPIQNYPTLPLSGKGVLIGFLDSGIDYTHPVFRTLDGRTRIAAIWDQTISSGTPPGTFPYGSEYRSDLINQALASDDLRSLVPSFDASGHGTYTASLAAGSGSAPNAFLGAAPEASIAVVKLKQAKRYLREYYYIPENVVCYEETDLMLGLRYLSLLADELSLPLVVCVSVGTVMGGHNGALPFSIVLNQTALTSGRIAVTGTGNEADKRRHYYRSISENETRTAEIRVGENIPGFTMELWTNIPTILAVSIVSPSGESSSRIPIRAGTSVEVEFLLEQTKVTVDYRILVERSDSELIFFRFSDPASGIWQITVQTQTAFGGQFHIWLPMTEFIDRELYFLEPDPDCTLTEPSSSDSPLSVAWYNGRTDAVTAPSGRGYPRTGRISPDIAAPGVNVTGAAPGGRFLTGSGSCAAVALTSGAVALMLEWLIYYEKFPGIDSYQIKSLLILGARRPQTMSYPNKEWGYGLLNLFNTFEAMRQL